jgi:putative SOS response-associated peptidase YedK
MLAPAMCGRYTNTAGIEELSDKFRVPITDPTGTHRYNIAPTEDVLAIVAPKGQPEPRVLRWGLIPPWAHDLKGGGKLINARIETVARAPAYRGLVPKGSRRALQIADGYYEWLKPEHRGEQPQPFRFVVDGGTPFAFAALWTPAKIAGAWIASVSLLTCPSEANPVAAAIHDRMPMILADRELQLAWLDDRLGTDDALALCAPLATGRLSAAPANPAVNRPDPDHEGPQLLVAPEPV